MLGKIAESRTLNAGLTRPVCVPNVFVRVVCGVVVGGGGGRGGGTFNLPPTPSWEC